MTDRMTTDNILPDSISTRYCVKKRIGKGGMGYVYLADDVQLMREVAIKTIRPELVENEDVRKRIERECKMHAAIRVHPHIVALYDKVTEDNNIFLIMEYVDGKNLSELISSAKANKQEIHVGLIVSIILQILNALSCIHRHGIIHRDIKPSNIIVGDLDSTNSYAKLMDFGIARDVLVDENITRLTMVDSGGPGTPAYMAPERIDSKTFGDICAATDLYSVGIILYELLCMEPPFHGTMTEVFSGHLAREPDFSELLLLPEALRTVLHKALEKKPADRYQDAQSFAYELQAAALVCNDDTLPLTSFNPSAITETALNTTYFPAHTARIRAKRKVLVWSVGIFLLVSFSAGAYFYKIRDNFSYHEDEVSGILSKEEIKTNKSVTAVQVAEQIPSDLKGDSADTLERDLSREISAEIDDETKKLADRSVSRVEIEEEPQSVSSSGSNELLIDQQQIILPTAQEAFEDERSKREKLKREEEEMERLERQKQERLKQEEKERIRQEQEKKDREAQTIRQKQTKQVNTKTNSKKKAKDPAKYILIPTR